MKILLDFVSKTTAFFLFVKSFYCEFFLSDHQIRLFLLLILPLQHFESYMAINRQYVKSNGSKGHVPSVVGSCSISRTTIRLPRHQ